LKANIAHIIRVHAEVRLVRTEMASKNIISCRLASYGRYGDLAYEHLKKIGIDHIELTIPDPEKVGLVLEELEKHDLAVGSLQALCDIHKENIRREFKPIVEIADRMATERILVSVRADEMDRKVACRRLRAMGDLAAQKDIVVLLETHPDMATNGDVALQTMKGVNHPNVRINFDTANIYYYNERVDGIEEMKKILEYIEGVHLKDTNGKPRTWYFPALGEGIVNFMKVRELLNKRGFFGPFTIEIEGIEGENLTFEQTLERMEKSVNHLKRCGF